MASFHPCELMLEKRVRHEASAKYEEDAAVRFEGLRGNATEKSYGHACVPDSS